MTKRCFIAVNIPQTAKDQLAEFIRRLKKINSDQAIRYVKSKRIHLTLHFLGNLTSEQIIRVQKILKQQASHCEAAEIDTDRIDAFPTLKNPRVIFLAGVQKEGGNLKDLQINLGKELEKADIKIGCKKWHPHLTLARVVGPCRFETKNLELPELKIPVESVELMESKLSPYGAEYKIISSYTLKSPKA